MLAGALTLTLSAATGTSAPTTSTTLVDAQSALDEDRKYIVETTADMIKSTGTDPVTFDECDRKHDGTEPPFWFKNKYNVCRGTDLEVEYYVLENGQLKYVGSSFYLRTFIGVAQDGDNKIAFGVRLIHSHDFLTTHKDTTYLSFQVACENSDPTRQSDCSMTPAFEEKSVRQWEQVGPAGVWFTANLTTTSVPPDKYAAEKRGFFTFKLITTAVPPTGVPATQHGPTEKIRCDEADYVSGSKCVFENVISSLSLDADDPTYGESARFIRDAQVDITLTKPGIAGKKVPGRWVQGGEPLRRFYSKYDTQNDQKGSRDKVRRTCQIYWGVDYTINEHGELRQCDEYPFASTYENAARVNEDSALSYAVRPINALHNETAGQIYGAWLTRDHILDGDPFYVIIR
ncbi:MULTISPECIES: NucA/NucB deoxyribonuclease domain-containing protein [Saccharothrix]|uniref:NucA/NucB deoxyribonuclease domain-containing protein n=1 Tax=Saccharothrix TaxID=2071 RepID=UPI00130158D7|nr:hypothetical protein [Saccharothrix sp. CB00851]